jgi:hypothetical protein
MERRNCFTPFESTGRDDSPGIGFCRALRSALNPGATLHWFPSSRTFSTLRHRSNTISSPLAIHFAFAAANYVAASGARELTRASAFRYDELFAGPRPNILARPVPLLDFPPCTIAANVKPKSTKGRSFARIVAPI